MLGAPRKAGHAYGRDPWIAWSWTCGWISTTSPRSRAASGSWLVTVRARTLGIWKLSQGW